MAGPVSGRRLHPQAPLGILGPRVVNLAQQAVHIDRVALGLELSAQAGLSAQQAALVEVPDLGAILGLQQLGRKAAKEVVPPLPLISRRTTLSIRPSLTRVCSPGFAAGRGLSSIAPQHLDRRFPASRVSAPGKSLVIKGDHAGAMAA